MISLFAYYMDDPYVVTLIDERIWIVLLLRLKGLQKTDGFYKSYTV